MSHARASSASSVVRNCGLRIPAVSVRYRHAGRASGALTPGYWPTATKPCSFAIRFRRSIAATGVSRARHGDYISDEYIASERAAVQDDLQRLTAIDRTALSEPDRLAYDTFRWKRETDSRRLAPEFVLLRFGLPIAHFGGWHLDFAQLSSGEGIARYATVADYDDGLSRLDGFVVWLDRARERLRQAADAGIVLPRVVVERMIPQFQSLVDAGAEGSMFYGPVRKLSGDWPAVERERITRNYATAIHSRLMPAFVRMRDFLQGEYLPRSRRSVGLSQLPGGDAWYRQLVAQHTTTRLLPEEIHRMGLAEVARITASMDAVRIQVGFEGTLAQFFEHLRVDARFKPASAQAYGDGYRAIGQRVDATLPRIFAHRQRAPLEIRPTPGPQDQTDAAARYDIGAPDGSRPGVFYYNTYDMPSRATYYMETLYLHEAVPGHHFQGSLAQENEALPKLLRFDGNTAFGKAGRCTPRASARSSACLPTRTNALVTTTRKSGARCGWSSTPACMRWAGRASRRSTTCWRTPQ